MSDDPVKPKSPPPQPEYWSITQQPTEQQQRQIEHARLAWAHQPPLALPYGKQSVQEWAETIGQDVREMDDILHQLALENRRIAGLLSTLCSVTGSLTAILKADFDQHPERENTDRVRLGLEAVSKLTEQIYSEAASLAVSQPPTVQPFEGSGREQSKE
jgi:hypothetical protein